MKKNIVFLMTDQQRFDAIGCVNPQVKTPFLDKLAREGVLYNQAVCNGPMCVPSRYSLMLGLYPSQTGVRHNTQMCATDEQLEAPTMAQRLKAAGYRTGGFGKTHWYIGEHIGHDVDVVTSTRGFDVRSHINSNDPLTCEPGAVQWADEEHNTEGRSTTIYPAGGESFEGYMGETVSMSKYECIEGWSTKKALEFLDDSKDIDDPFFLYLCFDAPHPPFKSIDEFDALYNIDDFSDDDEFDLSLYNKNHGNKRPWYMDWVNATPQDRKMSKLRYYSLCSMIDWQYSRVYEKLEEIGKLDDTVIVFTSDHGDMMGDRLTFSKYSLYEGSVRVPLIVWGKDVPKGVVDSRHAELVDIVPTMLDIAGEDKLYELPGDSLLKPPCRIGAFSEMHGCGYEGIEIAPTYMWRKNDYKLLIHQDGKLIDCTKQTTTKHHELYDMVNDPLELNNLYYQEGYDDIKLQLTTELLMHITSCTAKWPRKVSGNGLDRNIKLTNTQVTMTIKNPE